MIHYPSGDPRTINTSFSLPQRNCNWRKRIGCWAQPEQKERDGRVTSSLDLGQCYKPLTHWIVTTVTSWCSWHALVLSHIQREAKWLLRDFCYWYLLVEWLAAKHQDSHHGTGGSPLSASYKGVNSSEFPPIQDWHHIYTWHDYPPVSQLN